MASSKKTRKNIDNFSEIEDFIENIDLADKKFVDYALAIAEQVRHYLAHSSDIKSQRELAEKLGKTESEVSRWLSGLHNISLESIAKLSAALGEDVIMTDIQAREKYQTFNTIQITYKLEVGIRNEFIHVPPRKLENVFDLLCDTIFEHGASVVVENTKNDRVNRRNISNPGSLDIFMLSNKRQVDTTTTTITT